MNGRSALETQIHIIEALRFEGPILPTALMRRTNTSWVNLIYRFIPELMDSGLVAKSSLTRKYYLTEKGVECLDLLERAIEMIRPLVSVFPRNVTRTQPLRASPNNPEQDYAE